MTLCGILQVGFLQPSGGIFVLGKAVFRNAVLGNGLENRSFVDAGLATHGVFHDAAENMNDQ